MSAVIRFFKRRFSKSRVLITAGFVFLFTGIFILLRQIPEGSLGSKENEYRYQRPVHPKARALVHSARRRNVTTFHEDSLGNFEPPSDFKESKNRPGDGGVKVDLHSFHDVDWNEVDAQKNEYGMNLVASSYVKMDRVVPDIRHPECKHWSYSEPLPTASVVIVFHNEGFTTLLRTVHSVLIRSPRRYLREVLLVDDFSDKEPLKEKLEDYILEHFGDFKYEWDQDKYNGEEGRKGETLDERSGKVRLVRNKERGGLINSRSRGAREALGDVVVFLDAHCEVSYNWLPPLLAPIAQDDKTLTVPVIDGIDSDDFKYRPVYAHNDQHFRGIWEWGMLYKEIELDMKKWLSSGHRVSEPYDSPTHAGGLFAIKRDYFMDLGMYDPGLLVWGGENFELSFKVWQCGGRIQWVPCSRVGHIYRPFMPYSFGTLASKRKGPLVLTNYKRVIEVWFDDQYKEYFYAREPLARFYDSGDISKQLELKKKHNCKSFDWFMKNVASDVFHNFPRLPSNVDWGQIRSKKTRNKCLDTHGSQPVSVVGLTDCHGHGGNQLFRLNGEGQLGVGERCIKATRSKMTLDYCKLGTVNGPWQYDADTHHLRYSPDDLCLDWNQQTGKVHLEDCDSDSETQQWIWKKIKPRL